MAFICLRIPPLLFMLRVPRLAPQSSAFPSFAGWSSDSAIDIVWRGPVSLALGFLRPLALRGSAWWSPSPGWCSIQSFSRTSVLPFLTLTHQLTVPILLLWCRFRPQTPMVSLFLSCVYVSSASTPLLLHILPSGSMIEIVLIKYSGNCIIGNVIIQ